MNGHPTYLLLTNRKWVCPLESRTLSCSPSVTVCSCVGLGLGLGIGFREWVPIRNIIGGATGAHIPMTFWLQLSACLGK